MVRQLPREEGVIFEEDRDDDRSIYMIEEGYVDIKKKKKAHQSDGTWTCIFDEDDHIVYDEHPHVRLKPGDCFGESCLLYLDDDAEYKRNFSAVAATDVKLFMLNRVSINNLRESQPEAYEKLKPFEMRRLEKVHKKAVETLRAQGVTISDEEEPTKGSSSLDDSMLEGIQAVLSGSLEKMVRTLWNTHCDTRVHARITHENDLSSSSCLSLMGAGAGAGACACARALHKFCLLSTDVAHVPCALRRHRPST